MQSIGGGLIVVVNYATYAEAVEEAKALITEDGHDNIWTENSKDILV
jgi:hypothetical protein